MKISKLSFVLTLLLALAGFSAASGQKSQSFRATSPRALVADLYQQHAKRSPFFQTRSRALLRKYFTRQLAALLWQDAHTSSGEVGALDGDPLYDAQDTEIKKFSIEAGTGGSQRAEIPVTFENFGERHQVTFHLVRESKAWKIEDIAYDTGTSLLEILKGDGGYPEDSNQSIKIYLVAVGDAGKTGKKIGCDDSLVAVSRTIKKTGAPLTAAIRELLQTPEHPDGSSNLENFWKGRNLKVESVAIVNQTATIRLSGEIFVAGICDEPRIEAQLEETARQFPGVKKVKVFIGRRTLADAIR